MAMVARHAECYEYLSFRRTLTNGEKATRRGRQAKRSAGEMAESAYTLQYAYGSLTDFGIVLQRATGHGRQDEDVIASLPFDPDGRQGPSIRQ